MLSCCSQSCLIALNCLTQDCVKSVAIKTNERHSILLSLSKETRAQHSEMLTVRAVSHFPIWLPWFRGTYTQKQRQRSRVKLHMCAMEMYEEGLRFTKCSCQVLLLHLWIHQDILQRLKNMCLSRIATVNQASCPKIKSDAYV